MADATSGRDELLARLLVERFGTPPPRPRRARPQTPPAAGAAPAGARRPHPPGIPPTRQER
jgi:hypothetical protein